MAGRQRVSLAGVDGWTPVSRDEDILAPDQALSRLAVVDPRAARVVELRFFTGLQEDEAAIALGVSEITVKRDWKRPGLADFSPPLAIIAAVAFVIPAQRFFR